MMTKFTGSYGLVIKPDAMTQERAVMMAKKLAPGAEFQTEVPHITLYHAKFRNLPAEAVQNELKELAKYEGTKMVLNRFQIFGDKWLFWDLLRDDQIQSMHEESLKISPFLDKQTIARAVTEGLNLDKKEKEYSVKYGHPLVLEKYLPHISLAYDKRGLSLPVENKPEIWEMTVDKISLAEIGDYGSVKRIINI
jgi:2'-5' RNA ligase